MRPMTDARTIKGGTESASDLPGRIAMEFGPDMSAVLQFGQLQS